MADSVLPGGDLNAGDSSGQQNVGDPNALQFSPDEVQRIAKDPVGAFARATKLLLTGERLANTDAAAINQGLAIAKSLLPDNFTQQQAAALYSPEEIEMIHKDPLGSGKRAFDTLASAGDTDTIMKAITGLQTAKAAAAVQGVDFNKVLSPQSKPMEALDFLFNVLNTPQNALASIPLSLAEGKMDLSKIWGGRGFADVSHAMQIQNPAVKEALEARAYGNELTPEQQQVLKDYGGGQLAGNILNLSTLAIGGPAGLIGKAPGIIGKAGRAIKTASEFTDPLNAVAPLVSSIRAAKAIRGADEVTDVIKGIAGYGVDEMSKILKSDAPEDLKASADRAMKFADAVLSKKPGETSVDDLKFLRGLAQEANVVSPEAGKNIAEAIDGFVKGYANDLREANRAGGVFRELPVKQQQLDVNPGFFKKAGRAFRRMFVSDAPEYAHNAIDLHPNIEAAIASERGNVARQMLDTFAVKAAKQLKRTPEEIYGMVRDATERPEVIAGAVRSGELAQKDADLINKMADFNRQATEDILMAEAKRGSIVTPLEMSDKMVAIPEGMSIAGKLAEGGENLPALAGGGAQGAKEMRAADLWKSLQKEYVARRAANPTAPELRNIEENMRGLIKATRAHASTLDMLEGISGLNPSRESIQYLPHYFTKEARKWIKERDPDFGQGPSGGLLTMMHGSLKQRGDLGNLTVSQLNDLVKRGEIFPDFAKDPRWKGAAPKMFEDNPGKLLQARAMKSGSAVRAASVQESLSKLAKEQPNVVKVMTDDELKALRHQGGFPAGLQILSKLKSVNPATGEKIHYLVEPDVAKAVDRMLEISNPGVLARGFDKIQGAWKKLNLQYVPAYHIRNEFGNVFNNYMAGLNPISDIGRYIDAVHLQTGNPEKVKFLVNGRIWTGDRIMAAAEKEGILTGSYSATEGANTRKVFDTTPFKLAQGAEKIGAAPKVALDTMVNAGQALEANARLALFMHELAQGKTPAQAAQTVKKFLYDYNDLTSTEKQLWRRIVPFYSFLKKNAVLQMQEMFNPANKSLRNVERGRRAINEGQQDQTIDERYMNPAFADSPRLTVYKDPARQKEVLLRLEGLLPQYDVARFARWFAALTDQERADATDWLDSTLKGIGKIGNDELLANVTPFPKNIMELAANKNFFTGQPIRRTETDVSTVANFAGGIPVPPEVAHVLKNIRLLGMLDQTVRGQDNMTGTGFVNRTPELDPATKAMMWTLGKPAEYDKGMQKAMGHTKAKQQVEDEITGLEYRLRKLQLPSVYQSGKFPTNDYNLLRKGADRLGSFINEQQGNNTFTAKDRALVQRLIRFNQKLELWKASYGNAAKQ